MTWELFASIFFSIVLLLFLVLRLRLNAFLALLVASIGFGLTAGLPIGTLVLPDTLMLPKDLNAGIYCNNELSWIQATSKYQLANQQLATGYGLLTQ